MNTARQVKNMYGGSAVSVGAEKLLGRGDMLFTSAWDPQDQISLPDICFV